MARHDLNRRDMKQAYGRYSGSDQGDERRHEERREHGVYGFGAEEEGPGYDREDPRNGGRYGIERTVDRDDYYDPDHSYRQHDRFNSGYGGSGYGRREFGPSHYSEPYGTRSYSDVYGDRAYRAREPEREAAWRHPSSWYAGERNTLENWPEEDGFSKRVNHGYRGAGGYRSPPHNDGHRGRGPKGYARSDERIREDVCDGLTYDRYIDASHVEVMVKSGEVTLSGKIESRGARRHAEELAERALGVKHVQNNLRVADRSDASEAAATPLFNRTGADKR